VSVLLAVTGWDPAPWLARLGALLPGHALAAPETLRDRASVRYGLSWRHPPGVFVGLPNLQAIFSLGAGVDHVLVDPRLPDVPVVRVIDPDLTTRMSEWVVMQVLLHHRQFRRYDRQQAERIWEEDENQPAARDVRVGLLGLGELGRDAARKLQAIGFDVAGWTRSPRTVPGLATHHGPAGLDALLARTDILVSLLPLTSETRGILNSGLIAKLARDGRLGGPFLINAGRGGSQVEADIVAALNSGALKGASLDVFEIEPLPSASPLWRHPNVFLSPHNSAISTPVAVARYIADQILAHGRGEPLRNVVDRARGY
jgi:glyoxylate/hydroxypyruvate reductase A